MTAPQEEPQIVTYRIPRIEVYQVTDDELRRIEDGFGQIGQDLTFAVASISCAITLAITLVTVRLSQQLFITFVSLIFIFAVVALYTGIRWLRARKAAPAVIATIRARKVEPQVERPRE